MTDVETRLTAVEQRCKSNGHRLDHLEKQQEGIQVMAAEQKHQTEAINTVREDVSRLDGKVDALEMKPGKRWEGLTDKLLWGVAGAVLTWLLARAGL